MSSRTEEAYLHVVLKLQELGLRVQNLTSDYELGLMNAFLRVYGRARDFQQSGCLFHHVVCVHKAVGRLELVDLMLESEIARKLLRRLCSLPRLPADRIAEGFRAVYQEVRRRDMALYRQLYPLLMYYHQEWLVVVRPTRLSVFRRYNATNNTCETSHTDFIRHVVAPVPNTWDVVGMF